MKLSFNNTHLQPSIIEKFKPTETPIYDNVSWTVDGVRENPLKGRCGPDYKNQVCGAGEYCGMAWYCGTTDTYKRAGTCTEKSPFDKLFCERHTTGDGCRNQKHIFNRQPQCNWKDRSTTYDGK